MNDLFEPEDNTVALAKMKTTMALHPFDNIFEYGDRRLLLSTKEEFSGEMTYAMLASMGAQA